VDGIELPHPKAFNISAAERNPLGKKKNNKKKKRRF